MRAWLPLCGTLCVPLLLLLADEPSRIEYVDVAGKWGLTVPTTFGGKDRKDYILETTGTGAAIFDYDGDGRNDVFIANGTTLQIPVQLRVPSFIGTTGRVTSPTWRKQAGLTRSGWAQAACVADFDNDGHPDLLVTYYGHNSLYRNLGNGKFSEVTAAAGLPVSGTRWGSGCAFVDYDRDGTRDIFITNYVDLDLSKTPRPGIGCDVPVERHSGNVRARGACPKRINVLFHNNRDGTFTDVSEKAGILDARWQLWRLACGGRFRQRRWPDIYVACDMTPSLLYRNRHDGTFKNAAMRPA